jgi:hypothetical protein
MKLEVQNSVCEAGACTYESYDIWNFHWRIYKVFENIFDEF